MPWLEREDVQLHYDVRGDGPVVLLTHGFSSSGEAFAGNAPAIVAAGCRLVTWDLRGHGRTNAGTDADSYTVARVLGDMAALLDEVGAERAVVGGHSLGGYLSLAFRIAHADRVAALILLDTGPGYRDDTARAGWNRFVDKEVQRLADEQPGDESAGWTRTAERILKQHDGSVIESLSEIDVPVLVIVGEKDKPFRGGSAYMAEKIPDAELVVIEGAGHSPNVTHREEFDRCVTKFVARGDEVSRVLTVSATYGAGGSVVAPGLAERLGLHFYDRLTHGPETRTPERIAERLTEEERTQVPPGRVVASLSHLGSALGMPLGDAADLDPSAELRRQVAESVARIAAGGGGVVLGRGAAVLLASHPTTFHVRLDGPVDRRVAQGMRLEDVTEQIARSHQADTDKAWSRFVQRLFERDPADPRLYHLIVDSTAIPLPNVIELVAIAAGGFWAAER